MALSTDLISQFAKITKDDKETKQETIVYGKAIKDGGTTYVQIDGSDMWTPVTTTTTIKSTDKEHGERVTVMIKDHTATILGNTQYVSARNEDVEDIADAASRISEFEIIVASKADVEDLSAETARIDELVAQNALIRNELTTSKANIGELQADNATINEKLTAAEADISQLETDKLDVNYATITDASIKELDAGIANINTLIFGSAAGEVIQTTFSNAVIAQLGDAQIKSAMIESVSADKITAGDIITNNVRVKSEDGSLLISDETMLISDDNRVRVQIGKDAAGDYSINVWDQNGNLMFSKGGITDSAIKDAIIRNDMVSDTANIAAHKLDIDSLFEEINGSTNTIKSTQVYLDDEKQTLNLAFKEMSDTVEEQGSVLTSLVKKVQSLQEQINQLRTDM